jgi:hypothetical protein
MNEGAKNMDFFNATIKFPFPVVVFLYVAIWVLCLGGLWFIWRRSMKQGSSTRWTTQDILSIAIVGVIMMLYNSIIADRFIGPLAAAIPGIGSFLTFWGIKSLPYQFILMVGIVVIRKPGCATALIFLKYVLEQLIYGSAGVNPMEWPRFLYQGLFIDAYILMRGGNVLLNPRMLLVDAFIMGLIKDMPRTQFDDFIMNPFLSGKTTTLLKDIMQTIHDAISHAIWNMVTVHLALRVAKSVSQVGGQATVNAHTQKKI